MNTTLGTCRWDDLPELSEFPEILDPVTTDTPADSPTLRTFRLLQHIASGGKTANLSELSRETGINRATAMRLLEDLEEAGVIERGRGGHRPGIELLKLAATSLSGQDLPGLARSVMERLGAQLGLTVYLAIRQGRNILYLLREVPQTPLVSNISIGSVIPAHLTTPGRVLLAQCSEKEIEELLGPDPLEKANSQGPSTLAELRPLLGAARADGFAWSESGFEAGISSCAAPVLGRDGQAIAAISVVGPSESFAPDGDRHFRGIVQGSVTGAARDLSDLLRGIQ